ncbi:MAG: DUF2779 domain-containing protein [Ignavibacteriales bacterium]|nr:DUF2779 domain-containing protein [Ignavibacteriales bacterium]
MREFSPFISKSKYLNGLQCYKLLWFYYNAKDQIPAFNAQTLAIFDQGHLVGELAKKLYLGGIEIAASANDFGKILELSKEALSQRKPLFEAAFKSGNAYARADILNPVGKNDWEIIEVKSSMEVKEVNLHDLALQQYAYEGAGLSITKCFILHINNEYVRKGEVEPKKLFTKTDVTEEVQALMKTVRPNLEMMVDVIRQKREPDIEIGPHCSDPYGCPVQELCWKFLPEHNPLTLYYFKKEKAFELIHDGHLDIRKLPASVNLSEKQDIQVSALQSRKPHIDKSGIRDFLNQLVYPVYYLDFETFGTAIPLFDDVRPYEQIPFQFSLHIVEGEGKKPKRESFLADGASDPRPEILKRLKELLGNKGSIVAYNAPFEKDKLSKASGIFKEYAKWYDAIEPRFVDLLTPFKSFYYYHPDQCGSASIKAVLPALTGKSYEGLEIAEGGTASLEYLRVTFGDVEERDRQKARRDLETYCALDTGGMVMIVEELERLARSSS